MGRAFFLGESSLKFFFAIVTLLVSVSCANNSEESPELNGYRVVQDIVGDTGMAFVDIDMFELSTTPERITVKLKMLSIPESITYNSDIVPGTSNEFSWDVVFDVAGAIDNNEIVIFSYLHNRKLDGQKEGSIADFPTAIASYWTPFASPHIELIEGLEVSVADNTITFDIPRDSSDKLKGLNGETPVRAMTRHYDGIESYSDTLPHTGWFM